MLYWIFVIVKGHQKPAFFWCSSGPREDTKKKICFSFVLAGFNGKLQFLGVEVSEVDFCMSASVSMPAGEKQAAFKQIVETASVFFNFFAWKVRVYDICRCWKEKIGRILDGPLESPTDSSPASADDKTPPQTICCAVTNLQKSWPAYFKTSPL